jgi:ATP-dependent DNA ligase
MVCECCRGASLPLLPRWPLTSQPIDAPADVAFQHICQHGLEGIVSKKLGSKYESGRPTLWLKTVNPNAPALQRLEQEDWRG